MDITAVRRAQLRRLIDEHDSQEALAAKVGVNPTYISNLKTGHKSFGEKAARKIEKSLGLPTGWMDQGSDEDWSPLIRILEQATPEKRQLAIRLMRSLLEE